MPVQVSLCPLTCTYALRSVGYGWAEGNMHGHNDALWNGEDAGFGATNLTFRQEDITLVVLSNVDSTDTFGITTALGARLLAA